MDNKINMQKILQKKSKWLAINLMIERGLITQEKSSKLKRDIASGKVIYNPLVGLITKIEQDNLVRDGVLIFKNGVWFVPAEEIISGGIKKLVIGSKYSEWINKKRAFASADRHRQEEIDSLVKKDDDNKSLQECVDQLFPGNEVL